MKIKPGVYIVNRVTKKIVKGPYKEWTKKLDEDMFEILQAGTPMSDLKITKFDGTEWGSPL